ncbi:MAG: 2-oxoglutarate dehydrogenase, E2 component, dihydrolipoamide succinyltransferase [Ignavibacteriaceae bacterium]
MEIIMPKMGESINEGTIIKWHKKPGDKVERDEVIFEISTDKVDTEIPSPESGILKEVKFNEGDTVEVGTVVAVLETSGEGSEETENSAGLSEVETETTSLNESETEQRTAPGTIEEAIKESTSVSESGLIDIAMPKMGESVMEGTIIKWYKKSGDKVKKDETIFEISTDKVDTEVPSPESGILAEILVGEQETVEVGTVVARIAPEGAVIEPKTKEIIADKPTAKEEPKQAERTPEPVESASMHDNFASVVRKDDNEDNDQAGFLSPLVLSIANKENVSMQELKYIKGTGIGGRITKNDILDYLANRKKAPVEEKVQKTPDVKEKAKPAPAPEFTPDAAEISAHSGQVEKIPMDNIRQKIMQHMVASRDTSVHVSAAIEVDMTRIHNFIQKNKDEYLNKEGVKLTYMAFISYAAVKALRKYPLINASIDGTTIIKKKYVNLGIAVAIEPTGLIVPNIKGADNLNISGLAKAIQDVAYRSRNKKLTPDDISGGTFTITNYGVFGTIFGTPIINQPEVAILGVGAVVKKPLVIEADGSDTISIRPVMMLTLSHDHRLVDGMLGGLFLKEIKDLLENFDFSTI